MMVFVPLPVASASTLRGGTAATPCRGFAATPSLRRALGAASDEDEAGFAALDAAGVAALDGLRGSRRLVLAADVDPAQVRDRGTELGEVEVADLSWAQVRSLFADEEVAAPLVTAAADAARGVTLPVAFDLTAVTELRDSHDLLWYAPEELDGLR
jgi:uncharacterized protein DUF6912